MCLKPQEGPRAITLIFLPSEAKQYIMTPYTTLTECYSEFGAPTRQTAIMTDIQEFIFTRKYTVSPLIVDEILQLRPAMTQIVKPLELL